MISFSFIGFRIIYGGFALYLNLPNKKGTRYENATSYKLMGYLFDGYKSSIRPVKHAKTTTNITFQLSILQIIDIVSLIKEEHLIFYTLVRFNDRGKAIFRLLL